MQLPRDPIVRAAWLGAAAMVAQQVLAKTLRDTLFLAHHPATRLPLAFTISAVMSVALALAMGRALERWGPRRVMPVAWLAYAALVSGVLTVADRVPGAAFALYVLVSSGGVALASGFWLQVGEAFDPRAARHGIAGIGSSGALGGLAAGAAAWFLRGAGGTPTIAATMLALLVAGAVASLGLSPLAAVSSRPAPPREKDHALARIFRSDLLRTLAILLTSVSAAATLLDWRFKADVAAHFSAAERVGVFAAFYGITSALVFVAQAFAAGPMLATAGIGRTLATLPGGLVVASLGAMTIPGALGTMIARGVEVVLRGSLFRSGYELLFTPLDAAERRTTKGLLDVGFDRLGDVVGAVLAAALIALGFAADRGALGVAAGLAALGFALALRIERGYRGALTQGLHRGSPAIDPSRSIDRATLATLALTGAHLGADIEAWRASLRTETRTDPAPSSPEAPLSTMDTRIALLESGDLVRVRFALASPLPLDTPILERVIGLLARDDLSQPALRALRSAALDATPAMARALLDPASPDDVRRRLPRAIVSGEPVAAAAALTGGLEDERFEVRMACGRALLKLHERHPDLALDTPHLIASVLAEAARGRKVWRVARDLDRGLEDSDETPFGDLVRDRTTRGLEHCFTLLALMLPGEPLRVAWRALHTGDPVLRGTALEYLEGALPPVVREALWPHLEVERAAPAARRSRDQALDDLLRASPSVEIRLSALEPRRNPADSGTEKDR